MCDSVIRTVFDSCDGDRVGLIHINQLAGLLVKLGKTEGEVAAILVDYMASNFAILLNR
jgi:hypothetical protein